MKIFTKYYGVIPFLVLVLFSFSLSAQNRSAKTNFLVPVLKEKSVLTNHKPVVSKYTESNVTVTTLLNEYAFPYDVSQSGKFVTLTSFGTDEGYFWSEATGVIAIIGTTYTISETGVIGGAYFDGTLGANVAGFWSPETQEWTFLGMNPAYPEISLEEYNSIWGMNTTGTVCVGMQWAADWSAFPYKWNSDTGYEMLDIPDGAYVGRPETVSDDGTVIGGHIDWMPVIWVEGEGYTFISEDMGETFAISVNGEYATGYSDVNGFLWERATGNTTIFSNSLGTGDLSPTCITDDGTIFGYACSGWPPMPSERTAFVRYTDGTISTFNDYAEARGMEDAQSWSFYSINSVSADGRFVIGAAVDATGADVSFLIDFVGDAASCDAPTDLVSSLVDDNNIVLDWTAVEGAAEYIVYRDNVNIATASSNTYTDTEMPIGSYCYRIATVCENGLTSELSNEACETVYLGINEVSNKINIYPNPVKDQITVVSSNMINNIVVFNSIGRKVAEYYVNNNTYTGSVADLSAGIYWLNVTTDSSNETIKIVVE